MALQVLYQVEITGDRSLQAIEFALSHFEGNAKAKDFCRRLVHGVLNHSQEIDRLIKQSSQNWKLHRMAKVDLTILRITAYEILFCPDIPVSVSIDEAIEIGKRYGAEDSPPFINGVLDQIALTSGAKELH